MFPSRSIRYYRTSNASADLRRCHDYGNTSGCVGGVGGAEGPCKPGLEARMQLARLVHDCVVHSIYKTTYPSSSK